MTRRELKRRIAAEVATAGRLRVKLQSFTRPVDREHYALMLGHSHSELGRFYDRLAASFRPRSAEDWRNG